MVVLLLLCDVLRQVSQLPRKDLNKRMQIYYNFNKSTFSYVTYSLYFCSLYPKCYIR